MEVISMRVFASVCLFVSFYTCVKSPVFTCQVLSVGKLLPPNVTYSYIISAGDNVRFKWSNMGSWRRCSRICGGKHGKCYFVVVWEFVL